MMGFPDPVLQPWELRALHFHTVPSTPVSKPEKMVGKGSALVTGHGYCSLYLSYWGMGGWRGLNSTRQLKSDRHFTPPRLACGRGRVRGEVR